MDGFDEPEESPVPAVQFERIPIAGRDDHWTYAKGSVNPSAEFPLFDPIFPLFKHQQARSRSNGKNGRSCSPG